MESERAVQGRDRPLLLTDRMGEDHTGSLSPSRQGDSHPGGKGTSHSSPGWCVGPCHVGYRAGTPALRRASGAQQTRGKWAPSCPRDGDISFRGR